MAYRRVRKSRTKKVYRKKRVSHRRRLGYKRRAMRPRYNPTYNPQFMKIKRSFDFFVPLGDLSRGTYGCYSYQKLTPNTIAGTNTFNFLSTSFDFRISDVYNVSEFGVLFDQYKLAGVKLSFFLLNATQTTMAANSSCNQCEILTVTDYDDTTSFAANIGGWNAAIETGRARTKRFPNVKNNSMSIFLRPKLLAAVVDTGAGTTGRAVISGWVDGATATDARFLGIKFMMRCPPTDNTTLEYTIGCKTTYYLKFKNRQ